MSRSPDTKSARDPLKPGVENRRDRDFLTSLGGRIVNRFCMSMSRDDNLQFPDIVTLRGWDSLEPPSTFCGQIRCNAVQGPMHIIQMSETI